MKPPAGPGRKAAPRPAQANGRETLRFFWDSPFPATLQDASFRLIDVNDAYIEFSGYSRAEMIGRDPLELMPPEDHALTLARRAVFRTGPGRKLSRTLSKGRLIDARGAERWFTIAGHVIADASGQPLHLAVLQDTTAEHAARERADQSATRMKAQQIELGTLARDREAMARRTRAIFDAAPLAIVLFDARTLAVVQINEVAARTICDGPAELVGALPEQIFPAESAPVRRRDMEAALAAGEVTTREYRSVVDGEARIWEARYLPLATAPGEPPDQLLLVATDVSAQRAAQQARLEAAIAQRDMLVREVHHRIKNNLQGVAGLLRQIAQRKPEVAEAIDEVVGQVQAIAQVYGLQVGATGPLSMRGVVEAITGSVQRTFGRTIRCGAADGPAAEWTLPEVEAIPIALTLNELLTNAVKHSLAGDTGEIVCTLAGDDEGVRVSISNAARLPRGFSLARVANGASGLGLVRALLPRRGASLRIEQAEAGRVVATVDLRAPVVARAAAA